MKRVTLFTAKLQDLFGFASVESWKQHLINQCNTNNKILEGTLCNLNRLKRTGTLLSVFTSNLWLKCSICQLSAIECIRMQKMTTCKQLLTQMKHIHTSSHFITSIKQDWPWSSSRNRKLLFKWIRSRFSSAAIDSWILDSPHIQISLFVYIFHWKKTLAAC